MKVLCILFALSFISTISFAQHKRLTQQDIIEIVLRETQPLKFPRGERLPLYLWPVTGVGTEDDAKAEEILKQLDARGIPVITSWNPKYRNKSLVSALRVATLQKKLGLDVNINASACMHSFCNGDPKTAHVSEVGEKFFDLSFAKNRKMGCPFALKFRYPAIKEQFEFFLRAYKERGIDIDFIFLDWEIDGPIEWNDAWSHSKRCKRCRENIPNINDFHSFQSALRKIRCEIQREVFANTVKSYFPNALIGNYAVYPHNGYRYWYDYFEKFPEGAPYQADGKAKYREWFHEFPLTGYTFAMPVVYTWAWTFNWYDFDVPDYRWFYNMLKVASNACQHTPADIPIISFVHWTTIWYPMKPTSNIKQFSERGYKELLWHSLLRGTDAFFLWCPAQDTAQEIRPLHQVYAASLKYKEFLTKGKPILFDVPSKPGTVISCLQLGNKVLVRRTDFVPDSSPIKINIPGGTLTIPKVEGHCQVLEVNGR